jgi:hypothetical protein
MQGERTARALALHERKTLTRNRALASKMQHRYPGVSMWRWGLVQLACAACGRVGFDGTDATGAQDVAAACLVATEPSRVSAYTFADMSALGHDVVGSNDMTLVVGNPQRSTDVPPGFTGYSLALDGASSLCRGPEITFDPTADHTACWWSKPASLGTGTDQFTLTCGYDTWTTDGGSTYQWRINNCNGGTAADFDVPGVYAVGNWAHICQTYRRATLTRTVYVNGDIANPYSITDADPIAAPANNYWCLGSYYFAGTGADNFWNGLMYLPIWFDRVLTPEEIAAVHGQACKPS